MQPGICQGRKLNADILELENNVFYIFQSLYSEPYVIFGIKRVLQKAGIKLHNRKGRSQVLISPNCTQRLSFLRLK